MSVKKRRYVYSAILIAVVFGLLFELKLTMLCVVAMVYVLCAPKFYSNQKKSEYEKKRFQDVNAYMSQMAQSFVYTKSVVQSLEETATCFESGRMHETLEGAFEILEAGKWDIKRAERDALFFIEAHYECEKLRNLHAFFLRVEELGGRCEKEFQILESMRMAWQSVVENIRLKRIMERNVGVLIYVFFLLVSMLMLQIMRGSNLDIVTFWPTQIISMLLIIGLAVYAVFMDNRLCRSLLEKAADMSEEKANTYFAYLENYDVRKERKKYASFMWLSFAVAGLFFYIKPDAVTLAISLCIIFAGCNIHTFIYMSTVKAMRVEIAKAFPKWLFDVMLLLQRESVEGAIEQSIEMAPSVLKKEITRISEMLALKSHDPNAYMSFLNDFRNQNIDEIMHKLYSLAVGANRDSEVLDVVMEKNIKYLEKAERDSMMFQDSMKSFTWIPFLCAGFGCIGYLVIAIVTSVSGIVDLIGA